MLFVAVAARLRTGVEERCRALVGLLEVLALIESPLRSGPLCDVGVCRVGHADWNVFNAGL